MKVIDLTSEYEQKYFTCLADEQNEWHVGVSRKEKWYKKMKEKGLKVKLALDDEDKVGGMIQYAPIKENFPDAEDLYFVYCIWVIKSKKNKHFRKMGMGKALLKAAEEDAEKLGSKGLVVWGVSMPFFMKASWFKKAGYTVIDKQGIAVLLWKTFSNDAVPPKWDKPLKKPQKGEGKVNVTSFCSGWCTVQNANTEFAKKACECFKDKTEFIDVDTYNKNNYREWRISDSIYVNGKEVSKGPPLSYDKFAKIIGKQVKKIK